MACLYTQFCCALICWGHIKRSYWIHVIPLQWRHNGRDGVSNHQPHDCLLNRLFRHRSKKTSKLHVTGLCEGNSPVTGEFPAPMTSNAEDFSIWWRHYVVTSDSRHKGQVTRSFGPYVLVHFEQTIGQTMVLVLIWDTSPPTCHRICFTGSPEK